jgi:hypothetical protein
MALPTHSMTDSLRDARLRIIDWIWTAPVLLIIALAVSLA